MLAAITLVATFAIAVCAVRLPLLKANNNWFAAVEFGSQTKYLLVDTGSPWTWTITNSTVCYDPLAGGRARCSTLFGEPYVPSATLTISNGSDSQARFSYADLSVVRGLYGFENLGFGASLAIAQASFVLATSAVMTSMWPGSGILGLSPDLPADDTNVPGTDPGQAMRMRQEDGLLARPRARLSAASQASIQGESILASVFNDTNLPAFFGLALSRSSGNSSNNGLLTIGESADIGDPSINATAPGAYVQVPLEPTSISSTTDEPTYIYYAANVTALVFDRDQQKTEGYYFADDADVPFTFDSGTEVNFVPAIHAALIASRFDPPGFLDQNAWFVDCDAQAPDVALAIGSELFHVNHLDMFVEKEAPNRTTVCLSAFQGDYRLRILGSPFLKNVYLEVYRPEFVGEEAATMWIASREYYGAA